jgi:hypothetical protein
MMRRDFITIFGAAGILIGQSPVFAQTFRTYNCYDGSQFIWPRDCSNFSVRENLELCAGAQR